MASIRQRGKTWTAEVRRVGHKAVARTFPTRELAVAWADRVEGRVVGMPMLRAALADHRLAMTLSPRYLKAVEAANYTESEIVAAAHPIGEMCGIYFLVQDGEVKYVGQTTKLFWRLQRHWQEERRFDSYAFIPCPPEQLDELEATYITLLLPALNTSLPWKRRVARELAGGPAEA